MNKAVSNPLDNLTEQEFLAQPGPADNDQPSVTVDIVILTIRENDLKVLLVRRKGPPYLNMWAIPGGSIGINESLETAALHGLKRETGLDQVYLEQLYTFGDPARDPRTRVITVAYLALVEAGKLKPTQAAWFSIYDLPELAFDHRLILDYALQRLRSKLEYTNVACQLVPEKFTLTELQRVYEVIWHQKLDKRNFRNRLTIRELESTESEGDYMLEELNETRPGGNYGPTKLYRFCDRVEWIVR